MPGMLTPSAGGVSSQTGPIQWVWEQMYQILDTDRQLTVCQWPDIVLKTKAIHLQGKKSWNGSFQGLIENNLG